MNSFETKVSGKWILAGEHSVLRGVPALVFPLYSRNLFFKYVKNSSELTLVLEGEHGTELQNLVWGVIDKACELLNFHRSTLTGSISINSNIPIGAGLGASASLCVAVSRWLNALNFLPQDEMYEFARQLENLFHGESSGVDVAVALSAKPLKFYRKGDRKEFAIKWQPKWYISYSGQKGVTSECVAKVKNFITENPALGEVIDRDMLVAVEKCDLALTLHHSEGFLVLREGMEIANRCFKAWGLLPTEHAAWLKKHGAAAVKPTGSGGGGYMLSLWPGEPPAEIKDQLIPCF